MAPTNDELARIRARHAAAPPGPYIVQRVLHCHQLCANVEVDARGRLKVNGHGPFEIVVLENESGRTFCEHVHEDVARLLAHVDELEGKLGAAKGQSIEMEESAEQAWGELNEALRQVTALRERVEQLEAELARRGAGDVSDQP